MNYIILDLEWDCGFSPIHKRFMNWIVQIGAIRLDDELNPVDSFTRTVCSSLFRSVSGRFVALTGITKQQVADGIPFDDAVDEYNAWVGDDAVTMTWSDSDLFVIIDNERCLLTGGRRFKIERYLDLQRYVQNELRINGTEITNQISLADAAAMLDVSADRLTLHTAHDDCILSAALLKKVYNSERIDDFIRDATTPEFYKRLTFKNTVISDINDPGINKKCLKFRCDRCGAATEQRGKWYYHNRWFSANFACTECDRVFNGRLSFKRTYDNVIMRRRICEIRQKKPKESAENAVQSVPEKL